MNKTRRVPWLLGILDRSLPLMLDLLLMGIGIALIVAWFATLPRPDDIRPRQSRHDLSLFQSGSIAILPPGTAGQVILYTEQLGKELSGLPEDNNLPKSGYLDYVPNRVMTQGVKERVAATIGVSESDLRRVRDTVFNAWDGKVDTDKISISQTMTARLTGSSSLQIQELSTPEQLITPGDATIWNWDVIPTVDGDSELYLILSVHTRSADGFPAAKDLKPRIRKIKVKVNPVFKVQKFFQDNLAIIVGLLSIASTVAKVPWSRGWKWTRGLPWEKPWRRARRLPLINRLRVRMRWFRRYRRRHHSPEPPSTLPEN